MHATDDHDRPRALVIGGSGRIGAPLRAALASTWAVVATQRAELEDDRGLDLLDARTVARAIGSVQPDVVFVAIDGTGRAEEFERSPELADALFVAGTEAVVAAAARAGAQVVFYSSDLVFAGTGGPYGEDDPPRPATVFGRAKLDAEETVLTGDVRGLVIRTSEVFGWNRASPNLAMEVWRRIQASQIVTAPRAWLGTPTFADDLAAASVDLVAQGTQGVVHVAGTERASRFVFAVAAAEALHLDSSLVRDEPLPLGLFSGGSVDAGLVSSRLPGAGAHQPTRFSDAFPRFRRDARATQVATTAPPSSAAADELRSEILAKVADYYDVAHRPRPFEPFRTRVGYAGRVYGAEELVNAVDAALDFWLTLGPRGDEFERRVRDRLGAVDAVLVNSGSTANLTAMLALTSDRFTNGLRAGDEVITPAVTFPTTLTPMVHCGLVPVFVDCEIGTYNLDPALVEAAISPRTRAIVLPHTLGNPCDMKAIVDIAQRHDLIIVEDMCDAFGARFEGRPVGTFGTLATLSFYPAHHITMGEGGAVVVNSARLSRIVRSVRDWGRDCWCAPGDSDTCGRRFGWQLGGLPYGYDHKYVYSTLGYNFKPTDIQAAIGLAQLDRLDDFLLARQHNFDALFEGLARYEDALILPRSVEGAEPAWFGFPITMRPGITRTALVQWLEANNIETRQIFAGNVLRQPAFQNLDCRVPGPLTNSDRVMRDTFFVGVYPGLRAEMLEFVLEQFDRFFADRRARTP